MTLALLMLACAVIIPTGGRSLERWPELANDKGAATPSELPEEAVGSPGSSDSPVLRALRARWPQRFGRSRATPGPVQLLDAAAVLDLLAACLSAGLPPGDAAAATATAAPDRLAHPLRDVAARATLGVDSPWSVLSDVPELSDLATLARRSADSGSGLSAGAAELAVARRGAAGDAAEATAERAGVLVAGPLALCFLPAFVVLGLVPTIAGLAGSMLGGVGVAS
ncbi:type II secretion system F family protein [uncultured Corynebacterium sp.]|uniref:type II secretion system F family protein n=1 Tax=uncultured Corynebacterium sp. TaxID=159447 RepID=UPI0025E472B2|nr:type II secretion system F family protein [uncultured Corynebacterium sp.]